MQAEPAKELGGFEGHGIEGIFLSVFGREGDLSVRNVFYAVVAYSDAVSISPKIFKDLGGTAEGSLGIDVPALFLLGGVEQAKECRTFAEELELSMELKIAVFIGPKEMVSIFSAKDVTKRRDRKEKARLRRRDEVGAA